MTTSETFDICKKIAVQLAGVSLSIPFVPKAEMEPDYETSKLASEVKVIISPKSRKTTRVARGVLEREHEVMVAILAPLPPKGLYQLQDLEAFTDELELYFWEFDITGRHEDLADSEVAAIFSPKMAKEQDTFGSGFTLTYSGEIVI